MFNTNVTLAPAVQAKLDAYRNAGKFNPSKITPKLLTRATSDYEAKAKAYWAWHDACFALVQEGKEVSESSKLKLETLMRIMDEALARLRDLQSRA